ncbi:NUDIX hydrolase [Corynebacterium sp. A21]|uniref:NUDIX hydrolase n=1 Tax=Corynebacterium sp. A21 TaxID=3457318 RepID=UPI003FD05CEB
MGNFSVSAATVTLDPEGWVLLIQRQDNGAWDLPGGVVELGEQPTEAAIRETSEETGFLVELGPLTGVYTHTTRGIIAHVFLAKVREGHPTGSPETRAVEWVPAAVAVDRVPQVFKQRIRDALAAHPGEVAFRAHDGEKMVG